MVCKNRLVKHPKTRRCINENATLGANTSRHAQIIRDPKFSIFEYFQNCFARVFVGATKLQT